jgi:hypothetical protein
MCGTAATATLLSIAHDMFVAITVLPVAAALALMHLRVPQQLCFLS